MAWPVWGAAHLAHLICSAVICSVTKTQLITNPGRGRKAHSLPQRTYRLKITKKIFLLRLKWCCMCSQMIPMSRYLIDTDWCQKCMDGIISSLLTCLTHVFPLLDAVVLCCSLGCIKWELPACSTSRRCLWTEKWTGGKYLPVRPHSALSIFLQRNASLYLNCDVYEVSLALFSYWLQMSSSLARAIIIGLSKRSCDRCHS